MRKKKRKLLDNLYTYNQKNGTYEISLSMNDYDEIFNTYDYAQFRTRDLDEEFLNYLYDSNDDIPLKYKVKLIFYIHKEKEDSKRDIAVRKALKNNIGWKIKENEKIIMHSIKKCVTFFFIGLLFFVLTWVTDGGTRLSKLFYESLVIIEWVFIWQAIEILAFGLIDIIQANRYLKRLVKSDVEFKSY